MSGGLEIVEEDEDEADDEEDVGSTLPAAAWIFEFRRSEGLMRSISSKALPKLAAFWLEGGHNSSVKMNF